MKKIAIVYHYLAHYRKPIFQELMKCKNIDFMIISGESSEINIKLIDSNISNIPINDGGFKWKFIQNNWLFNKKLLWQSGLINILIKNDFDGVIFLGNPYHLSSWISIIICKLKRIKTFYWMHGFYRDTIQIKDYIKLYIFYKLPNAVFLYGNRSSDKLAKLKILKPKDIFVIYNSLDYSVSLNLRKQLIESEILSFRVKMFNNDKVPILCFIGRVNTVKKINYLIEIHNSLIKEHKKPLFNILIIGDGEELDSLKHQVNFESSNFESVKFIGALYSEIEISKYLFFCDLCITPGEIGLTAIHALSYGTPVISHNNFNLQMPEIEVIKPGYNGELYEYNDINDLKIKILDWIDKYPIKNQEIVNNCYTLIDKYYNPAFQSKLIEETILTYV